MLGNNNYIDLTGQMEEVFDSKIQQINFLTEENVKDKIEEAVAEIEIKPELFDDVYAKIDHTHTSFNNLTVNRNISISGAGTNSLNVGKIKLEHSAIDNDKSYAWLGVDGKGILSINNDTGLNQFYESMTFNKDTKIKQNLTVDNKRGYR